MERWVGRVALVTGASAGIGASLIEKLAQHGMEVIGLARNTKPIEDISKKFEKSSSGHIHAISCDVTKETDVLKAFRQVKDQFGGVDICVNSAGLSHVAPLLSGETHLWVDMLQVNVLGLCVCTREAYKSMRDKGTGDGHIVNINSLSGHSVAPRPESHFYAATKFAVTAITEGIRNELRLAKSNIRVSEISPGVVHTEFHRRMTGKTAAAAEEWYAEQPYLEPGDVADAIIHVISVPPHVQIHDVIMRAKDIA